MIGHIYTFTVQVGNHTRDIEIEAQTKLKAILRLSHDHVFNRILSSHRKDHATVSKKFRKLKKKIVQLQPTNQKAA